VAFVIGLGCAVLAAAVPPVRASDARFEFIRVARDGKHFVLSDSKNEFHPWGFNYDHDRANRLLEDYWEAEWPKIIADFQEMRVFRRIRGSNY